MGTAYVLAVANVHGNVDNLTAVAVSLSREKLDQWEKSQRAPEPYQSEPHADVFCKVHPYQLVYKDGPLKWFNPPCDGIPSMGAIFKIPTNVDASEAQRIAESKGQVFVQ